MNNPYAMLQQATSADGVLPHHTDRYSGVTVADTALLAIPDAASFERALAASLAAWTDQKRRGLWVQVPMEKAEFIPALRKEGFEFHHAQRSYVMMTLWLPVRWGAKQGEEARAAAAAAAAQAAATATSANASAASTTATASTTPAAPPSRTAAGGDPTLSMIPSYANHTLGIGCIVFNSRGELLGIKEFFAHPLLPDFFKLPGGAVDVGEELPAAAEREVREETGVKCTFRSLLGFRHLTNFRFGTGDLYFIAVCTVDESGEGGIPSPVAQPEEISAARWWDIQEFFQNHSTRWMQELLREPALQEWKKLYPQHRLPPPPSAERIAELQTYPPHPQASEGKSYPVIEPPRPPPPGTSVGMPYVRFSGLLGGAESNFYLVTPPTQPATEAVAPASSSASASPPTAAALEEARQLVSSLQEELRAGADKPAGAAEARAKALRLAALLGGQPGDAKL